MGVTFDCYTGLTCDCRKLTNLQEPIAGTTMFGLCITIFVEIVIIILLSTKRWSN